MKWVRRAASEIEKGCGPRSGLRILHVSDFHNRLNGFRFARELVRVLQPEVEVNTGDLSGLGTRFESFAMERLCDFGSQVFAPGNHDCEFTIEGVRATGAKVLVEPDLVEVSGLPVWGYRDPNETPVFGPSYDVSLCEHTASLYRPPQGAPLIVAVHHRAMLRPHPDVKLVLTGHVHSPKVGKHGEAIWLRCGSTGGGRPFGGPLQAAIIDVVPETLEPAAVWLVSVGEKVSLRRVELGGTRAEEQKP